MPYGVVTEVDGILLQLDNGETTLTFYGQTVLTYTTLDLTFHLQVTQVSMLCLSGMQMAY